jgi:hypothetical protein
MKRLLITAAALASGPTIVLGAISVADIQSRLFTEMVISIAVDHAESFSFDKDPGDISVYRFGLSGSYSLKCKDGNIVGHVLPPRVDIQDIDAAKTLCEKIS